jgi:hypothetical protein
MSLPCLPIVCIRKSSLSVLYVHLSVRLFVCRFSVCLTSASLSACLPTHLSIFFSVRLSSFLSAFCLYFYLVFCLFVTCLCNYLSVRLFASSCFYYMYCMLEFGVGIQFDSPTVPFLGFEHILLISVCIYCKAQLSSGFLHVKHFEIYNS